MNTKTLTLLLTIIIPSVIIVFNLPLIMTSGDIQVVNDCQTVDSNGKVVVVENCPASSGGNETHLGTYNQTLANSVLINSGGYQLNLINGTNNPVRIVNTLTGANITISDIDTSGTTVNNKTCTGTDKFSAFGAPDFTCTADEEPITISCTGTDKVSAFSSSTNAFTCTTDVDTGTTVDNLTCTGTQKFSSLTAPTFVCTADEEPTTISCGGTDKIRAYDATTNTLTCATDIDTDTGTVVSDKTCTGTDKFSQFATPNLTCTADEEPTTISCGGTDKIRAYDATTNTLTCATDIDTDTGTVVSDKTCTGTDKFSQFATPNLTCTADEEPTTITCSGTDKVSAFSSTTNAFTCTTDSAGQAYSTIQEEGSDLTQRSKFNCIGGIILCADNAGSSRTDITVRDSGADPAEAGVLRFSNADQQCWEASPAGTDQCIGNNASENWVWDTAWNQLDLGSNPVITLILGGIMDAVGNTIDNVGILNDNSGAEAGTGFIRTGNAVNVFCSESSPAGADNCVQVDANENLIFDSDTVSTGEVFSGAVHELITKTNINTAFVDIYTGTGQNSFPTIVNCEGHTQVRAFWHWNKNAGAGTHDVRLADQNNNSNVLISSTNIPTGMTDTGWVSIPAFCTGEFVMEWQGKASNATDDPIAVGYSVYLR